MEWFTGRELFYDFPAFLMKVIFLTAEDAKKAQRTAER